MIHVLVDKVFPAPGESVWTAQGIEPESGDTIIFGGDWRPMSQLAVILTEDEMPEVEVEPWQVLVRATPGGQVQ